MERKIRLLEADEIEVRINQVSEKGASALLYKTARVDYEILDETFGIGNWQVEYQEIKGNLFCTVSIWDDEKKQWIKKQNCGVESREDGNGNEKKGEASDAVKRAGTVVGIGRELYSSPFIWLNIATAEDRNGRFQIKDRFAKFAVSEIGYDAKRKINRLVIVNQKSGEVVYTFGAKKPEARKKPETKEEPKAEVKTVQTVPEFDTKSAYSSFLTRHSLTQESFVAIRNMAADDPETGVEKKPFKTMTPDEWKDLLAKLEVLFSKGYFGEAA